MTHTVSRWLIIGLIGGSFVGGVMVGRYTAHRERPSDLANLMDSLHKTPKLEWRQ
jgi:hypothetical protein